jgi:hypothetical protein
VHQTRAALQRHVVGEHDRHVTIDPRVPGAPAFELAALHARQRRLLESERVGERGCERRGHEQRVRAGAQRHVLVIGMDGHREARRQRPRRGGPDDRAHLARAGERRGGSISR